MSHNNSTNELKNKMNTGTEAKLVYLVVTYLSDILKKDLRCGKRCGRKNNTRELKKH